MIIKHPDRSGWELHDYDNPQEVYDCVMEMAPSLAPQGSILVDINSFKKAVIAWLKENSDSIKYTDRLICDPTHSDRAFQGSCSMVAQFDKGVYIATSGAAAFHANMGLIVNPPTSSDGKHEMSKIYENAHRKYIEFVDRILDFWPTWEPKATAEAFDNLFLPPGLKEDIMTDLGSFMSSRHEYNELDLPWKRGYMFIGPPGNGKTKMIRCIAGCWGLQAEDLSTRIDQTGQLRIDGPFDYLLKTMGKGTGALMRESVRHFLDPDDEDNNEVPLSIGSLSLPIELITKLYNTVEKVRQPSVFFLEDIDKFVTFQGGDGEHRDMGEISLHSLLKGLDGVDSKSDCIIIATTNFPNQLAEAISRPGRFDRMWEFPKPEAERIMQLFRHFKLTCKKKGTLEDVAKILADGGASMAFAEEVVKSAFSIHKRRELTGQELMPIIDRIKKHIDLCNKKFGKDSSIGFGK